MSRRMVTTHEDYQRRAGLALSGLALALICAAIMWQPDEAAAGTMTCKPAGERLTICEVKP